MVTFTQCLVSTTRNREKKCIKVDMIYFTYFSIRVLGLIIQIISDLISKIEAIKMYCDHKLKEFWFANFTSKYCNSKGCP